MVITIPRVPLFRVPRRTLCYYFAGTMHALFAPLAARIFADLDIGASVWLGGDKWNHIHRRETLIDFELEHGIETERFAYNKRCLARAKNKSETVVAHLAGFTDFFVPVRKNGRTDAVLVTGPLAIARPTGADVLARWRSISGRQGHPSDPEFAHYLATTLSTLVLEGKQSQVFQKLLDSLAKLMSTEGGADATLRGDRIAPPRASRSATRRASLGARAHAGRRENEPHLGEPAERGRAIVARPRASTGARAGGPLRGPRARR